MAILWNLAQQAVHKLVNVAALYGMVIIEDHQKVVGNVVVQIHRQSVRQPGCGIGPFLRERKARLRHSAKIPESQLNRGNYSLDEPLSVDVRAVHRVPADWDIQVTAEIRQQRGLAVSGWRTDRLHASFQVPVKKIDQTLAAKDAAGRLRHLYLRRELDCDSLSLDDHCTYLPRSGRLWKKKMRTGCKNSGMHLIYRRRTGLSSPSFGVTNLSTHSLTKALAKGTTASW